MGNFFAAEEIKIQNSIPEESKDFQERVEAHNRSSEEEKHIAGQKVIDSRDFVSTKQIQRFERYF